MKLRLRVVLFGLISLIALAQGISELLADTVSWPVSVGIPTGMLGEMSSKPVSVGIPTGVLGEMSSKPVSVAMPTTTFGGVYESRPASVSMQPANLGDPDLIGLWHMDGDWSDSSGNGNNLAPVGGVGFSSDHKGGFQSATFNGSTGFATAVPSAGLGFTNNFTLMAWVNPSSAAQYGGIVDRGQETVASWELYYNSNQSITYQQNWNRSQGAEKSSTSTGSVPLSSWTHVAVVYIDKKVSIYINGKEDVSAAKTFTNNPVTSPSDWLEIGVNREGADEYFNGLIDEVAIYKRALTVDEIAQHYAAGINDDPNAPAVPTLNTVPAFVGANSITLSGTKPANTSIWVNNKKIAAADASTTWQGSYATLQPGTNLLNITALDETLLLQSAVVSKAVFYDNIAPFIESSIPANGSNTAKDVNSVTITLSDANAGVDPTASIQGATVKNSAGWAVAGSWSTAGAKIIAFTPTAPFASDTYTVTIQATDLVGNKQQQQIVFTTHDTSPPTTKATLASTKDSAGWYSTPVTVTLSADDTTDGSGVAKIEYSLDSGTTWLTYATAFVIDTDGKTTLQFSATDKAGNAETAKSQEIKINKTGLVGWWKMDGDWKDSSLMANDGTPYNGTTFSTNVKIGTHAGSFDGSDDYTAITNNPILNWDTGDFAVSFWIKAKNTLTSDKEYGVINKNSTYQNAQGWGFELSTWGNVAGKVNIKMYITSQQQWNNTSADYYIDFETWHHVVGVRQGNTISIFINGILQKTITHSDATRTIDNTEPLIIGKHSWGPNFNGLLDDIRIYNRALSATEVMEQYRNIAIGVPTVDPVTTPVNTPTITLSGTKPANTSIVIASGSNSTEIAPQTDATAWAATTWQGQYTLASGMNNLSITSKDVDGYHSQAVTVSVALDDSAPTVVSSTPAGSGILNAPVPVITINLQDSFSPLDLAATISGATVKSGSGLDVSGAWTTSGTGSAGAVVFTADSPMGEGVYTATITPTDSFGNKTTATISFTVDMTAPVPPIIDPVPSPANTTGKTITGGKSSDSSRVVVACPGAMVGTVSYPSATTWSVPVSGLKEGVNTITAYSVDSAGNQGAPASASFTIDLTPPAKPTINAPATPTKNATITLTGGKEANSWLYVNNSKQAAPFADTTWSAQLSISEGTTTITVFTKDEAGNQSPSTQVSVVRDTTAPTIAASTPSVNAVSGTVASVSITLTGGTAAPDLAASLAGAVVKTASGSVIAGTWSVSGDSLLFTPTTALPEGVYTVTIYPVDALGNKGSASFSFTVDQGPPTVQTMTINPSSPLKAGSATFTLTFSEAMDTTVQPLVTFGAANYGITGAWSNNKTWRGSYTLTTAMGDGTYAVTVKGAKDLAGNTMADQAAGSFVLDTVAPAAPTVAAVTPLTKTPTQLLTGTKAADSAIVINGTVRVPLNNATTWSYSYPLVEGANTLAVTARDAAGNDSPAITPAPLITLDTTPPLFTVDVWKSPATAANQTISGAKEPGCIVKLNTAPLFDATDQSAAWSTTITLVDGISNRFTFTITDAAGNVTTKAIDILYDSVPPTSLGTGMLVADGSGKGTEVALTWPSYPEPAALAYYRVFQGSADFSAVTGLTPVGTVSKGTKTFKAAGLTQGTRYFFAIVPVSSSGNSDPGVHTASAVPTDTLPPEEVASLRAVAGYSTADGNTATLSWSAGANTNGDLADQILYTDAGQGYDGGAPLGKTATGFTKKGLADATLYKFKITVKDTLGHESAGTTVQAVTRLANPTGLTATAGNTKATLAWQPVASPYLKLYNIYRIKSDSPQSDVAAMTLVKSQATTAFTDTGLTNDSVYQYAVTVLNSSGAERTGVQSVAVTPRGDTTGPVIGGLNLTANKVVTAPFAITATATDAESALDRMELYLDDVKVATVSGGTLSFNWNVIDTTDGNHTVKIAAYDAPGNKSEISVPVVVSLAPPPVPVITSTFPGPINQKTAAINGTAQQGSTVSVRVNGVVVSSLNSQLSTFSFASLPLVEGDNYVAVKAGNRGGDSAFSADLKISVITTAPSAPAGLAAKQLAGGSIQFTWQAGSNGAASGYNLYEAPSGFTAPGDAGVRKTNTGLISYLLKEQIPADDTPRFYAVTAVDGAGNESPISNVVSVASDRQAPTATVAFTPGGGSAPGDNTYGPGTLNIALTVSETLSETPFLSLEPQAGSPLVVALRKTDDTHYEGNLTIDATASHGPTTWKFSGKDAAGNRGNNQGIGPILDVRGPQAAITAPVTLLKTTTGPVAVSITLDEPSTITPAMALGSASLTGLTSSDNIHWSGTVDPAALPEGTARFTMTDSRDRFNNRGTTVVSGANIILYTATPPAPSVPMGLTAKAFKAGEMRLAWKPVTDAQGYNLYRKGTGDAAPAKVAALDTSTAVTYSETIATDGTYAYTITSVGLLGTESAQSDPVTVTSDGTAPPVPTGLTLSMTGNGIKAEWQAGAGAASPFYRLYRSNTTIADITGLAAVATVKELTGFDPSPDSAKRFYAVTSLDEIGNESAPSAAPEFVFPAMPVRNLVLTRVDDGKPALSWEAGEANLQGFHIYRNGNRITTTPTLSTTFSDGYYSGGSVTYGVSAVDSQGTESPVREATLPEITLGLKEGTLLRRGVLENVVLIASLPQGTATPLTLDSITLKIGGLPESSENGPFTIQPGTPLEITKVAATEATAQPQTAVVATAVMTPLPGVTIKVTRSLLAGVIAAGGPLEIFNEPLVRGTQASIRLKVTNTGSARSEFVTSENGGPSSQVRVLLKDQDGNLLAQGRMNQRLGATVVDSGTYATARLEPGESILSDPITFSVPANAPYKVSLVAVIDSTWYHYQQADQVMAPGFTASLDGAIADVSYTARATTAKTVYKQGEAILISGTATSTADSSPMANVPVKVGVSVKGFDRFATVNTDAAGNFSYTFTPNANEAGSYSVWAIHPDLSDRTVQAQFSIIGLQISPLQANIRLLKGHSYDIPVTLVNLGGSALNSLSFTTSASSGVTAAMVNPGADILNPGETRTVTFRVGADQNTPASGFATLDIATAEGPGNRVDASVTTITAIPVIVTSPSYIDTGLMRGNQRIENLTITNTGAETLINPRIEGPSLPWLVLTVDKNIGDIPAGQSRTIGILIKPADTLAQGVYDDRIVIQSDNHIPYTFNVQVTVTSSAVGSVQFSVLDELMRNVKDASITFQNQSVLELVQTIKTDTAGTAAVFDLPEGRYSYNISAAGAMPTSGSFVIVPGTTVSVPVALELSLVKVEWSVTPVVIEDRYDIQITQTYQTNVPTPVLVVEPAGINIPNLQPGQVFNGEFTLSNYGLIALDNVSVSFPNSIDDYDIELMANTIPKTLGAMQKVVVPYRITRRITAASASTNIADEITGYGGGTCYTSKPLYTIKGTAVICPNTPQQKTVEKTSTFYGSFPYTCGTGTGTGAGGPTSVTSSGGTISGSSGGTYTQGVGGAGTPVVTPLSSNNPCDCKPDNTPCTSDGNLCTDDFCNGGKCIHFPNSIKLPDVNIGDCKDKVCSDGASIDKINDNDKPMNVCKDCSSGNVVNLADGTKARDNQSCCFAGAAQPNYPIIDVDKCPNRVRNTNPDLLPNGCGSEGGTKFPDNPMWDVYQLDEGYYSNHNASDGDFKLACDGHDNCYATCNSSKMGCDVTFGDGMKAACYSAFSSSVSDALYLTQCLSYAISYETAVRYGGKDAYNDAQTKICNCCYK